MQSFGFTSGGGGYPGRNGFSWTYLLLAANGLCFVLQHMINDGLFREFMIHGALWPLEPVSDGRLLFRPWQVLSYSFLHGDLGHLFFNMLALWMFGQVLEQVLGSRRFITYYVGCVLGAAVVQLVVATIAARTGNAYPTVGASGGVFGLLLAFGWMFPRQKLMLLFLPVPVPARAFVIGYGALELFLGVTQTASGIAHFAHLGGMVAGFCLLLVWKRQGIWQVRGG